MLTRLRSPLRTLGWITAAALVAVTASERVYWYWAGFDVGSMLFLAAFYAIGIAVTVVVLGLVPARGLRTAVLGGAIYALVIEGVITPVVYEDGPLPVLFFMFVGWHGLLAFVGFVYLVRRWLLARQRRRLWAASVTTGLLWGGWALASGVTDRETALEVELDGGSSAVLTPAEFAVYAALVGVTLIIAHVVMDRLWPPVGWRPTRTGVIVTAVTTAGLAALLVLPAVPWAPLKLGAIGWLLWWALRRRPGPEGEATLIDQLAGRILFRDLLPLMALPGLAAGTYAVLWPVRQPDAMALVYWSLIGVQVVAGGAALWWAMRGADTGAAGGAGAADAKEPPAQGGRLPQQRTG